MPSLAVATRTDTATGVATTAAITVAATAVALSMGMSAALFGFAAAGTNTNTSTTSGSGGGAVVSGDPKLVSVGDQFVRGNANDDGWVNVADANFILNFLFKGGIAPVCRDAADVNDDGTVDISDAKYLLGFLFSGTAAPKAPWPARGTDPTVDNLTCKPIPPCTPDWSCTAWSACTNGTQTRECVDSNVCGTTTGKPSTVQSCSCVGGDCSNWSSRQISPAEADANVPSLASVGTGYGVVWRARNKTPQYELYFTPLDLQGNRTGADVRLTNHDAIKTALVTVGAPKLVGAGETFGLFWIDFDVMGPNAEGIDPKSYVQLLKFMQLASDGRPLGVPLVVERIYSDGGSSEDMDRRPGGIQATDHFAVAWTDREKDDRGEWNEEIMFARISRDGKTILSKARVTNDRYPSQAPSLIRMGGSFGLAWEDANYDKDITGEAREIAFQFVDFQGMLVGTRKRITDLAVGNASSAALSVDGQNNVVITYGANRLTDPSLNGIYRAKVSSQGVMVAAPAKISEGEGHYFWPVVAGRVDQYAVAWSNVVGAPSINNYRTHFKQVDSSTGQVTIAEEKLAPMTGASQPYIDFNGQQYAAVWIVTDYVPDAEQQTRHYLYFGQRATQ